jgi:LmbE family N-acetylglucosaminyl deacetylase
VTRMKIRIYFRPVVVVVALAITALLFWSGWLFVWGPWHWAILTIAVFFTALFTLAGYALFRCAAIEHWMEWRRPERLLILVPHQDDCVLCAGGIGVRNTKLGGKTFIVYFVQDELPGMAERRAAEVAAAWSLAGVAPDHLRQLDLLPPLRSRKPECLPAVQREIARLIDEVRPSVVIMPMFEGGHIHHDILNQLISLVFANKSGVRVFESPEYSPFFSLRCTPHRVVAHCGRWLFGICSYYGPPDGIDERPIYKIKLDDSELAIKRKMLGAFVSQNGPSLARASAYPDRIVEWRPRPYRARPFQVEGSYLRFVLALERLLPQRFVGLIFPGQRGTIGREPDVTNLDQELGDLIPRLAQ